MNVRGNKGVSIVGVYRGTVDVKDNLGSEKAISPQNDKTEAVLVSKQFSTTKLILKKRVFSKRSGKNKKS